MLTPQQQKIDKKILNTIQFILSILYMTKFKIKAESLFDNYQANKDFRSLIKQQL